MGKPAGVRCCNLDEAYRCGVWGSPQMPEFCREFAPSPEVCGTDREQALSLLRNLELSTRPAPAPCSAVQAD